MRKNTRTKLALLLLGVSLTLPANVSAEDEVGLAVGTEAPKVELKDQNGNVVNVSELLKKGPVAIVFYRSADW